MKENVEEFERAPMRHKADKRLAQLLDLAREGEEEAASDIFKEYEDYYESTSAATEFDYEE